MPQKDWMYSGKISARNQIPASNQKEVIEMSNSSSNSMEVPQAKEAMDKFKMEVASEIGVPLKNGYNGDLTSKQAGSIGGEMVRQMIKNQEQSMSGMSGK